MGLKDDLIKREQSKNSSVEELDNSMVKETSDNLTIEDDFGFDGIDSQDNEIKIDDSIFGDEDDLSNNQVDTSFIDELEETNSIFNDPPIEKQVKSEPKRKQQNNQERKQRQQRQEQSYYEEPEQPIFEPPKNNYNLNYKNYSHNQDLSEELLKLAKVTLMNDINENFESSFLTKEAKQRIVKYYTTGENTKLSNEPSILATLIDEVIASDYSHDHYNNLVEDILKDVKSELGF